MTSALTDCLNKCPIKDSNKIPRINCISCGRSRTSENTNTKFTELMENYEKEKEIKKQQKEEEIKKQKELRKLQKKDSSNSDPLQSSRPPTKRQVEKKLKQEAKILARKEESPEKITPEEPIAHKDNDGKLRISGTCPICKHKVNSFISKDNLSSEVLDYLKVDLTEKPKKRKRDSEDKEKEVSEDSLEIKKQKKSKKNKKEVLSQEIYPCVTESNKKEPHIPVDALF